jgi:hypothetical protein
MVFLSINAEIARICGVSRARVSQVMGLLGLSACQQEDISPDAGNSTHHS